MRTVVVTGRFMADGAPVDGEIDFQPSRLWVSDGDTDYATLAPKVPLIDGRFTVELTPTDTTDLPWRYTVVCPAGKWSIKIQGDGPLQLRDLLPSRFQ